MIGTLQIVAVIIGVVTGVGGFLFWHFSAIGKVKEEVQQLKLEMKELEKKDALQQQTLDQFQNFYPLIKDIFGKLLENKNIEINEK